MSGTEGQQKSVDTARVACSGGEMDLSVGQQFTMFNGDEYVIESFRQATIYSPSGAGGTPIALCRYVGGEPIDSQYEEYARDRFIDFCADSIALAIQISNRDNNLSSETIRSG